MTCPVCHYQLDRHTPIAGHGSPYPESGDQSLCIGCGALLVFDGRRIRRATPAEEREAVDGDYGGVIAVTRRFIRGEL